ncbi:hypothetical protein Bbelb_033390 [Branchiostoma belcheri]|nr:hypothetical protein Bbelb_033390 [Branchiostoma belcheri]
MAFSTKDRKCGFPGVVDFGRRQENGAKWKDGVVVGRAEFSQDDIVGDLAPRPDWTVAGGRTRLLLADLNLKTIGTRNEILTHCQGRTCWSLDFYESLTETGPSERQSHPPEVGTVTHRRHTGPTVSAIQHLKPRV